ncbi:MAG TPA: iron ABC transporter permease [Dehalococcoidia bacterium]|nr:iron ABC transporter permease [Dehalococcoidia bacterium]
MRDARAARSHHTPRGDEGFFVGRSFMTTTQSARPIDAVAGMRRTYIGLSPISIGWLVLIAAAAVALTQGAATIPASTTFAILLNRLPLVDIDVAASPAWERIVIDVRLPRVLIAGAVGAALSFSGAAYQGVFRNPLADPFLLGVAAGAGLGASIAIILPLETGAYGFGWVPVFAFAGALVAVAIAYLVSQVGRSVSNTTLILAGVAVSAVCGSATSFILITGGELARPILSFLFGSFNSASWERLALAAPYLIVGSLVVGAYGRVLNVLQLDEEQASQLGVDVPRVKLIVLVGASLVAATAVATAGVIGFVGLIVPHVVRMLFGGDHRQMLPLAALLGAAFLIAADVLSRTVLAPQDIPVGIVTAAAGAPFFLYLLRTRRVDGLR